MSKNDRLPSPLIECRFNQTNSIIIIIIVRYKIVTASNSTRLEHMEYA